MNTKQWEEEFGNRFGEQGNIANGQNYQFKLGITPMHIKPFISSLLAQQAKEIEEIVRSSNRYIPNEETTGFTRDETYCYRDGYAQAIQDTLLVIRKVTEKQ